MSEITPKTAAGQAAFAEYYGRQAGASLQMPASWDMQSDATRADWEAAAQAAIDFFLAGDDEADRLAEMEADARAGGPNAEFL